VFRLGTQYLRHPWRAGSRRSRKLGTAKDEHVQSEVDGITSYAAVRLGSSRPRLFYEIKYAVRALRAVSYMAATPQTSTGTTHSSASKPIKPIDGAQTWK
jgi:hypothetical protein